VNREPCASQRYAARRVGVVLPLEPGNDTRA
jgi:hypothetical protein